MFSTALEVFIACIVAISFPRCHGNTLSSQSDEYIMLLVHNTKFQTYSYGQKRLKKISFSNFVEHIDCFNPSELQQSLT